MIQTNQTASPSNEQGLNQEAAHSHSHKDLSEWMAKKNLQQSEKQIDLILNRISLLKKEEQKTSKRIEDTKKKTDQVIQMKHFNQEKSSQKNSSKQSDGEYLKLLQRKSYEMRRSQEEEREAIRNALIEMKKEEYNEVKKQREINNSKIEEIKRNHLEMNKLRHLRVKELETESKNNIKQYWDNQFNDFSEKSNGRKFSHLKAKNQKDLILSKLEKEEILLISRLEKSQESHFLASKELEDLALMPNQEVVEKYPPQKPSAKQVNFTNSNHKQKMNNTNESSQKIQQDNQENEQLAQSQVV